LHPKPFLTRNIFYVRDKVGNPVIIPNAVNTHMKTAIIPTMFKILLIGLAMGI
jgi:hypothetical protein